MIQPEFKPLIEILTNKLFRIPEYQRHYSWQQKQRNELFEDIKKLEKSREKYEDRMHFMATVVCLKTKDREQVGSNTFYIYDVVDGQQRLTTLVILLKAISIKLTDDDQNDEARELTKLLVKDSGRLIILQNNHDNRFILRNYLENGNKPDKSDIKTVADRNLSEAIKDCEKFVNSNVNSVNLLALIKNHLYFIFQSLEDKGAVYTIFEVLNSRGLDVDWLDKCKSLLMGLLYEYASSPDNDTLFSQHLNELHSYWSEIYREIGLQNIPGHEIIRFAATLKQESDAGRPISSEDALDFFKEDCVKESSNDLIINKIIKNTVWLKEITSCLFKLYSDKRRKAVTDITQARLLAVAIMLRKDLREEERNKLLEQWERTSFKIYGLFRKDSRTKVGDYVRVAKKIRRNASASVTDLLLSIAEIGSDFDINLAAEELKKHDFYSDWQKELRYFFFRYEEHLARNNGSQLDSIIWNEIWESNLNDTVEHILPQDKSNVSWQHFTEDEHKEFLHSIGNLCLLSPKLNSEASNKSFSDKKETYKKAKLISINEIIFNNATERSMWDKEAIKHRTENLTKFAIEQWKDL
ncbi:DUF262 domain-containing protein [Tolypothrix sp. FACHB-123]|uniref:DUF262 domain-containing protein n=1 Tax=Tolypothrix sp. FACHB-123 TaxID=2692868 RepID=UPI0016890BC2|nr:DUF262 domain-containing protein [Tolypothrix sp. FACHB-123]MBD2353454.1 DUF262 domain-containing protein [Tolypothrix sp. FACHB-123]